MPRMWTPAEESHLTMGVYRLLRAWRLLPSERRLAAGAALGLFVTLFTPWYEETVIARSPTGLRSISASLTGWQAFSFVEAAVLLVAVATLVLLFVRSEGGAFHVPGGDGSVITAGGLWTCLLIVWRMFDKEGTAGHAQYATTSGIQWGIFVALAVAATLAYAGTRIRLAHEPEPPLVGERQAPGAPRGGTPGLGRPDKGRRSAGPAPSRRPSAGGPLVQPLVKPVPAPDQPTAQTTIAARPARAPEMELDDGTWTQEPAAESSAPAPAVEPPPPRSSTPRPSNQRRRQRPRSILAADIDISESPTAPLSGSRKSPRPGPSPDDQLTGRRQRRD